MLKSGYVIRLYELIIQQWREYKHYNKNSKSYTFDLDVEELKTLFEIPNSYLYKDIRVNVIDKAKQQFKEKTNITFDYEEYKIGRAVKRLKITVKENNKGSNDIFANKKSFINHIRKEYIPNPYIGQYQFFTQANIQTTKENLNYEPKYSMEDGIIAYIPEIKRLFEQEMK